MYTRWDAPSDRDYYDQFNPERLAPGFAAINRRMDWVVSRAALPPILNKYSVCEINELGGTVQSRGELSRTISGP